jgi:polysaccharide export outer membrane protein
MISELLVTGLLTRLWASSLAATLFAGLTIGCAAPISNYNYAQEPDPRRGDFVLGPSDVLRITVWHNADLSGEATVRPDGTITMPLVGDLPAAGQTPEQLRAEIARRLTAFVKDESSTVTVAVTNVRSYRFTVSGNVERGGLFTSLHYVTVAEAITLAGGPNRYATPERTVIIRVDAQGRTRRIPINFPGIIKGETPTQNLTLVAGDIIYVP